MNGFVYVKWKQIKEENIKTGLRGLKNFYK